MRPNWMLWNHKGTDAGSSLFARMAASYGQGSKIFSVLCVLRG